MSSIIEELRTGRLLTVTRVRAYARILLALEIITAIFISIGTYGFITKLPHPVSTDFVSFYAAGYLANHGHPGFVYNRDIHYQTENLVKDTSGLLYNYFFYPPTFLLICSPLARLPYLLSFAVFETATAALYIAAIRRVISEASLLLPFIAFPAFLWTIGLGQNGLLTAALLAGATFNLERRPGLSGFLFGCLAFKPHYGLLIPVALIAGQYWRVLLSGFFTVLALVGLSMLIYGVDLWHQYLSTVLFAQQTFEQGRVAFSGLVSPFGAVRLLGGSPLAAYVVQIAVSATLVVFVAYVWGKPLSLPIKAAALTAAIMPSVPVILFYDFLIATVAIAWLITLGSEEWFLTLGKSHLLFCRSNYDVCPGSWV